MDASTHGGVDCMNPPFLSMVTVLIYNHFKLISVISLLSSDKPNLDSPANVDAAKEVRTEFEGEFQT